MKTFRLSIALLFSFAVADSQTQMRLGLAGGMNFSKADQINFYNSQAHSTTGFAFGGIVDCPISERVSLLIEPTYTEKGTYAQPQDLQGDIPKLSFDLTYLEVPVLLKYSMGKELQPYIVFGPSFGVNLSSDAGVQINGPWFGDLEVVANGGNMVNDVEFSMELGGGLSYEADDMLRLFIEARYSHALTNVLRQSGVFVSTGGMTVAAGFPSNAVYRNKGIILLFGFSIPL